jgi:hypothetical protein
MAVQDSNSIDFVTYNPKDDHVILVMVEAREWGEMGALLPELQTKLNTYLGYALDGRLVCDYPAYSQKPIRIELRTQYPPTAREQSFLDVVAREDLEPRGISFGWQLIH